MSLIEDCSLEVSRYPDMIQRPLSSVEIVLLIPRSIFFKLYSWNSTGLVKWNLNKWPPNIWSHRLFFFIKCLVLCFPDCQIKFTDSCKTTKSRLFRGSDGICSPHYSLAPETQLVRVFSCVQVTLDPFLIYNQNYCTWNCRCWMNDGSWTSNVTGTDHRYSMDSLALVINFKDILTLI